MFRRKIWWLLSLVILWGCEQESKTCDIPKSEQNQTRHSSLLKISSLKGVGSGYTVSISDAETGEALQKYILGADSDDYESCSNFIQIPVKKVVVFSATHLFMLDTLGGLQTVSGFSNKNYTANAQIRQNMENGRIREFGDFATADIENLILMKPDVVIISGFGDNSVKIEQLQKAGIPVIKNYEWRESTPLGRAEWIKLFGVLMADLSKSTKIFQGIENNYTQAKELAKTKKTFSSDFLYGIPFKGQWSVPGGASFMAEIFKDANIQYPWQENELSGSLNLDFESVAHQHKNAMLWLSCGHNSISSLTDSDQRFEDFEALKNGRVFNYHKKMGANGVVRYWEESVLRCDKLLTDFIEICHGDALEENLYFFKEVR